MDGCTWATYIDASVCLSRCRTLDAVHLATALLFRDRGDEALIICSLNERLRETATALGFPVAP